MRLLLLLLMTSPAAFANEITSCEAALREGTLPWRTLRRVRELALAYRQVELDLGASDFAPPRVVAGPSGSPDVLWAWTEVTDPDGAKHYRQMAVGPSLDLAVLRGEREADPRARSAWRDWDELERRAVAAPRSWSERARLAMVFVDPERMKLTLEPALTTDWAGPRRRVIDGRDLPTDSPVQLSPARRLGSEAAARHLINLRSSSAWANDFRLVREAPAGPGQTRVLVELRVRHPGEEADRAERMWILYDARGASLVDLVNPGDQPGQIPDLSGMHAAVRAKIGPQGTFALVREHGRVLAYAEVFRVVKTVRETFEVSGGADGFVVTPVP